MTGTFAQIDYRLRPAKHAERSMLIDLFKRLRFAPIESYQYVGFGSVAFVDFKMVHKALGITDLISIEDVDEEEDRTRFEHNRPYQCVDLRFGHSSAILPTLNFARPSLVWLDYDNGLRRSMTNDLATVASRLGSGSFIGITVAGSFPTDKQRAAKALKHLKENFPEFVADDANERNFRGNAYRNFVRQILTSTISRALRDADVTVKDPRDKRSIRQVCWFKYRDGTIDMLTIGWIVVSDREQDSYMASELAALPFFKDGENPYVIQLPLVTPHEIREMERRLPDLMGAVDLGWIPIEQKRAFDAGYRYLPSFAPIEAL